MLVVIRRLLWNLLWLGISTLIVSPCPCAAGLSYADNQVFPHGYVDLDRMGPLTMTDYPFASTDRKLVFQTSYRTLYNMKELTDSRAAFALSRGTYHLGTAFASFGEPDYFHQMGLSAFGSYRRGDFSAGGALIYSRLSFNNKYEAQSVVSANLGIAYKRDDSRVFILSRSINQARYYDGNQPIMPEVEIGVSYKSREGLDSQAKALFVRHQKPTGELSQSFRLNEFARISWALVLLPARFGGGLNLEKGRFEFDYKISHHPVLGLTHTIILTIFGTDN